MSVVQPNRTLVKELDAPINSLVYREATGRGKKFKDFIGTSLIVLSDLVVLYTAFVLAYIMRQQILPFLITFDKVLRLETVLDLWWLPILFVVVFAYGGLYHKRYDFWYEVKTSIRSITMGFTLAIIFLFLSKNIEVVPRTVMMVAYFFAAFLLPVSRYLIKSKIIQIGMWVKPILILGAGKTAELVIKGFMREPTMGYHPIGMLDDDYRKKGYTFGKLVIPVLGKLSDVDKVMSLTGIKDIVIAVPGMDNKRLVDLTNRLQQLSANIMLVPDLFGLPLTGIGVDFLFEEKILLLSVRSNLVSRFNHWLKRGFDLIVVIMMLLFFLPLMLIIAAAIRVESKGPVIFSHSRLGKNGKSFNCLKFRTMVINSQEVLEKILAKNPEIRSEWERDFKLKDDPRITHVGRFLRKTSLDELPQLFNVLVGQMSLVGPRPIITDEIQKYGRFYKDFTMVLPGITGLWQVSGRNDVTYEERVQLDVWYVRNWSPWIDITLLLRTISVVLGGKGAY